MDLEGFDDAFEAPQNGFNKNQSYARALDLIDNTWFVKASRSSRWMDLLGDYAGSEPFVIDGEALFQIILDDPLLAIGRKDCSFQILHAYHILESILTDYQRRSANFSIVFWNDTRHLSIQTGEPSFVVASRALARSMLFRQLCRLPFDVHVFEGLDDPLWVQYVLMNKPMFVMTNDGGLGDSGTSSTKIAIIFSQRAFFLSILSGGMSVALLKGAEYRDSKILSFVYEPNISTSRLLKALGTSILSARTALHALLSQDQDIDYRLRAAGRSSPEGGTLITKVFHELDILSGIGRGIPPEVLYLFIAHSLLVPTLSVLERAQVPRLLGSKLTSVLQKEFLSPLFFKAANLLASYDYPFEVDGTIFVTLIAFVLLRRGQMSTVIGPALFDESQRVWCALGGPSLDFDSFVGRYRLPLPEASYTSIQHETIEPRRLLAFSNPVFEEKFSIFQASTEVHESEYSPLHFEKGTAFSDNHHWHNQKSILPGHLGGSKPKQVDAKALRRRLRSDQRFMATLQVQAATLTGASGASLRQIIIPPVGTSRPSQREDRKVVSRTKQKDKALTSTEKLKEKIKKEKEAGSKDASQTRWTQQLAAMSAMSFSKKVESMNIFSRNPKVDAPDIISEIQLYRVQLELEMWIEEAERESAQVRDRYTVSIMRRVKDLSHGGILTPSAKKALSAVLTVLGFRDYISGLLSHLEVVDKRMNFRFIKLIDSKTETPRFQFMAITEHPAVWQLRLFGEFMDRSMDSAPDRRVAFEPDAWQRRVLDGIDRNKSLLVVAPTSAGKTFISYYAMEKVLRESDDGILVYIAPTKALVTQIAAEVYARFSKNLKGKSCWAIHTRDFRIHEPQNCQILVTVPEMLAIMLLSPPLARVWTPRIKRIVLDEIHSIGQQEGGAVWEQILLFAPCPIIGLSATIGSPERFSDWLSSVQKAHEFDYDFIEHPHRYSHLRKFFYVIDGKGTFKSLDEHRITKRSRFLHPISLLLFGARTLPPDLSLEAPDTLTLFRALHSVKEGINHDLETLEPSKFFSASSTLLRQKDILEYEARLKAILSDLLESFDPRDLSSPLGHVIRSLQDPMILKFGEELEDMVPPPSAFKNDILVLLADLHVKNELPAILFNFDRTNCEIVAQHLLHQLEEAEEEWRSQSPEWNRKIKQWEAWKALAAARERASERLKKQKKVGKDEEEYRDAPEASWESSFNPGEPSPQFSFVGHRVSYSKSDLERDIGSLRWTTIPRWAFAALRRGIAVHHAGMNKHYRSLVESLFRQGFVRVMIATGTLALGINAPTKTSVFCGDSPYLTALMYRQCAGRAGRRGFDLMGNVIFYGLSLDRARRLILSRLPTLGGNFPLTSTMTLRLFNLLDGSNNAEVAVRAIRSIISLPQITLNTEFGRDQLLHHMRFSIEYLRRSHLLDETGKPVNLFGIAAHLYYTEPSNLALVTLMRSGVLHDVCKQSNVGAAKKDFMIIMANLFGRRYLSKIFAKEDNIKELTSKYPSMVILPPLPAVARKVLVAHDEEILRIFSGYAFAFAKGLGEDDNTLPLSGVRVCGNDAHGSKPSPFHKYLQSTAIPVIVRSPFVANSGHGDSFKSVPELTRTSRAGLNLNGHAIPSMSHLTHDIGDEGNSLEHRLNAHILDFYIHGQVSTLARANCIRRGDVWYLLEDFALTLMTVKAALEKLLLRTSKDAVPDEEFQGDANELDDYQFQDSTEDPEIDNSSENTVNDTDDRAGQGFERPANVSALDWKVYSVVDEVCREFEEKFKAMWA
ncbi:hypothetical protein BDZ97DRAFT_66327 [Flammula alnicola]|nr:hypothetical protein BDZ97DRAFT_66327 [Flammula alnicola]